MKNILVLIDIQKEYTTPERPFYLKGIDESLANCRKILQLAREEDWTIGHIKHLKPGAPIFNPESEFSEFVDGFAPMAGESVFIKSIYSCFSNSEFCQFIASNSNNNIYLIGYNSIMCCLSTVIEGYHLGYHLKLVEDAVYAKSSTEYSELDMHLHAMSVIKTAKYAETISCKQLINECEQQKSGGHISGLSITGAH